MVVIGIDPGKTGGIAFMDPSLNCQTFKMPIYPNSNRIDVGKLQEIFLEKAFKTLLFGEKIAYVERQQVRHGQRGGSIIGENYGRILTVLELLDISYKEVLPWTWKGWLFPGKKTDQNKKIAIEWCVDQGYELPTLRPKGKILHDGVADAICIAKYGWYDFRNS